MSSTAEELEVLRGNDAALELIHQMGGEVVTRKDPLFEPRDWEAEGVLDMFVGTYVRNIAINYHEIIRERHIGPLGAALAHRPCAVAVVGAGPSLDKNVEHLRQFPGLIIACDRAAKALTARGIFPDMVVCVDPRAAVMAEMLNYPENRAQRLILSVFCDPEVARIWRGPKHYMSTMHAGTQFHDRILPELFPGMPGLHAAGNVGNTAVQLAEWLGASKIVLVGQDYGYTGGQMHCADAVRFPDGSWRILARNPAADQQVIERRTGKIEVEGVTTYKPFLSYRDSLYEIVKAWELNVVNATEGGILTALPQAPLSHVVEELKQANYQADEAHALLAQATGGGT